MDIHLAGTMDGIEAAGKIHAKYGIPVIFLTAYADSALLERAKVAEPYGYILKPYDERGLHSAIEMALYKHAMEQRLKESEATTRVMVNATQDLLLPAQCRRENPCGKRGARPDRARTTTGELQGTSAYDLVGKKILYPEDGLLAT